MTKKVDLRNTLNKAGISDESFFIMIKNSPDGIFVIPGYSTSSERKNDYLAAWFFIPKAILSSFADPLTDYINKVTPLLKEYDGDDSKLGLFNNICKQFKDCNKSDSSYLVPLINDNANGYAIRYYESSKLATILSPKYLFQPVNAKYEGVLLIDKSLKNNRCQLPEITDELVGITNLKVDNKLKDTTVILKKNDKEITLENGKNYLVHEKDKLQIIYRKKNFAPRDEVVSVPAEGYTIGANNMTLKVPIDKSTFVVTDKKTGEKVEYFTLRMPDISGKQKIDSQKEITEEQAKKLLVEIVADKYMPFRETINMFGQKFVNIELSKESRNHTYRLPLTTGEYKDLTIPVDVDKLPVSPVDGFAIDKNAPNGSLYSHTLKPATNFKSPKVYIPLIVAAIIGFALGFVLSSLFSNNASGEGTESPMQQSDTIEMVDLQNNDTASFDSTQTTTVNSQDVTQTESENQVETGTPSAVTSGQ